MHVSSIRFLLNTALLFGLFHSASAFTALTFRDRPRSCWDTKCALGASPSFISTFAESLQTTQSVLLSSDLLTEGIKDAILGFTQQTGLPIDNVGVLALGIPLMGAIVLGTTRPPTQLISSQSLEAIVDGTYLSQQASKLECVYKASRDGWSALAFHDAVDGKGSGIVVARTLNGKTFGGFNPNGWRSTDDYYISSSAFLWCLDGGSLKKMSIMPGGDCSVFDYATSGPCFGASDLVIGPQQAAVMGGFAGPDSEDMSSSAGSLREARSAIGTTYRNDRSWPVRGRASLVEVEVYCRV